MKGCGEFLGYKGGITPIYCNGETSWACPNKKCWDKKIEEIK